MGEAIYLLSILGAGLHKTLDLSTHSSGGEGGGSRKNYCNPLPLCEMTKKHKPAPSPATGGSCQPATPEVTGVSPGRSHEIENLPYLKRGEELGL